VLLPLAAAVLVGGALAVYYGAFRGDGESDNGPATTTATDAAAKVHAARASLTERFNDKQLGISAGFPASWRSSKGHSKHLLESRDHCISITLAAPAPVQVANRMRRDAISILRGSFKRTTVAAGEKGREIGGVPTRNDVITVSKGSGSVRVLLGVGRGKQLAYLSQVVLRDPSCGQDLLEAQLILNSARFSR
jgi:hypothetical protein